MAKRTFTQTRTLKRLYLYDDMEAVVLEDADRYFRKAERFRRNKENINDY
ncbi:hypothetical protein [Microbacterium sp. KR10-403]